MLLHRTGDLDGARDKLERALPILESAFGRNNLDVARVTYSLGFVEYDAGNLDRSRVYFERALESNRKVFGAGHTALIGPLYSLACLSALAGNRDDALRELREAIDCGLVRGDLLDDPDLDSLRGDPEFEVLVKEVKAKLPAGSP